LRVADEVMVLVAGRKSLQAPASDISNTDLASLFFGKTL
jgi:branched-chain amino acid transport system ATP-binding protein